MSCPESFKKNAIASISCAHDDCDKYEIVPLTYVDDCDIEPPIGYMRIDISAAFKPRYFEKRLYFFCEKHARELLPGFFEYFLGDDCDDSPSPSSPPAESSIPIGDADA